MTQDKQMCLCKMFKHVQMYKCKELNTKRHTLFDVTSAAAISLVFLCQWLKQAQQWLAFIPQ